MKRATKQPMPKGMRQVSGRWYWRPTDELARRAAEKLSPGRSNLFAGATDTEARKWWATTVLPLLDELSAPSPTEDRVESIIDAYLAHSRFHELKERTRDDYRKNLLKLRAKFGSMKFARSEAEAATGAFLRRMHIAQHLDDATAKVMANRQVSALSSAFSVAIRAGRTEYNPCSEVSKNRERPRRRLIDHHDYAKLKHVAQPVIRLMMLMAKLTGMRQGDLRTLRWDEIRNGEIHKLLEKTESTSGVSLRIRVTPAVAAVLRAAKELRGTLRQSEYVFHNRQGEAYTLYGFQSMWRRTLLKSGVVDVHFHDLKARAVTDKERKETGSGTDLAGHTDPRTTRRIYRRGAVKVDPVR